MRQGVRLRSRHGRLLLVSVATPAAAVHPEAAVARELHATSALRDAERHAGADSEPHILVGGPAACLLAAARDQSVTLIAVGSHGSGRLGGILAGSVATAMLHRASTVDAVHIDERDPVDALLDAAGTSDLLVLGARGLHGLRALGSVSGRVAHRASASVLVVRDAAQ